jgi:NADH:ubiquinone oxidoreductase subunit 6 (subunit J)
MVDSGPEPRLARVWRGVSGALAVGLVLLAVAMIGVQVYAGGHDLPGPGLDVVSWHVGAAVAAVVAQVVADRRKGWVVAVCGLAVVLLVASTLWFFWWA